MPVAIPNTTTPVPKPVPRATSRRGGRSRSPVAVDGGNSAAAAAAAAAAQALGRSWPPDSNNTGNEGSNGADVFRGYGGAGGASGNHGGSRSKQPPPHQGGPPPPPHGYPQQMGPRGGMDGGWPPEYRSSRGGGGFYGDPRGGPPYPPRDPHHDFERRYDRYGRPIMPPYDYRYRSSGGGQASHHHDQRMRYHSRHQPLYGGASPIPKSPVVSGSGKKHTPERHRAPESVFRKPPSTKSSVPPAAAKLGDESPTESPKLLTSSLQTPTPSFDQPLDSGKANLKSTEEATTPKDITETPTNNNNDSLFSMRSGEGSKLGASSIEMAPSFPLLTTSFSFGGGESNLNSMMINTGSFGIDAADGGGVFRSPRSLTGSPVQSFVGASPMLRTFSEGPAGGSFGPFRPGPPPLLHNSNEPPFYTFLRKFKDAFRGCTFLLPGIQSALERNVKSEGESGSNNNDEAQSGSDATGTAGNVRTTMVV